MTQRVFPSASEVTTLRRYTNLFIIINIKDLRRMLSENLSFQSTMKELTVKHGQLG